MATAVDYPNIFYISSLFIYGKYAKLLSWSTAVVISKFADKYENNAEKTRKPLKKTLKVMFDGNYLTLWKNYFIKMTFLCSYRGFLFVSVKDRFLFHRVKKSKLFGHE